MHGPSEPSARAGWIAIPFLLLPSLLWILTDHHVWPWDPAWYGEVSGDLWSTIVRDPAAAWGRLMLHAIASKPPAVVWFGQLFAPLASVLGWEPALLLSILVTQAASLLLLHASLARLFGPRSLAVWAGVLTMAASPLFIGLTHQYFAEPGQLLSVCLFLWIAVNRRTMGGIRLVAWLLLAAALGLVAKTTTPIYVFGFGLAALTALVRRPPASERGMERVVERRESPLGTTLLAAAAVGLAALTAGWYVVNAEHTLQHALQSATGAVALHYGSAGAFSTKLVFWLNSLKTALLLPWVDVAAVIGAAGLVLAVRGGRLGRDAVSGPSADVLVLGAAALHVAVVLTIFSLNINEESRFLLPLFPSVAVLVAAAVAATGRRTVGVAVAGFLALQWVAAQAMALGWVPVHAGNPWLQARDTDGSRVAMLTRLAAATCPSSSAGRINLVGTEQPWLNANTMAFFSARARAEVGWRCYYTSLGYAEADVDRAWDRLQSMQVDEIIMLDADRQGEPNILNQINVPVRQRLETDAGFAAAPFAEGVPAGGITVFQRRKS